MYCLTSFSPNRGEYFAWLLLNVDGWTDFIGLIQWCKITLADEARALISFCLPLRKRKVHYNRNINNNISPQTVNIQWNLTQFSINAINIRVTNLKQDLSKSNFMLFQSGIYLKFNEYTFKRHFKESTINNKRFVSWTSYSENIQQENYNRKSIINNSLSIWERVKSKEICIAFK